MRFGTLITPNTFTSATQTLNSGRGARLDLKNIIFTKVLRERGIEVPRKKKLFDAKSANLELVSRYAP
jgi:hypothetical protein